MRLLAAFAVVVLGGTLAVMGISQILVVAFPRSTGGVECGGLEIANTCYYPKHLGWIAGFGLAGFAVLISFYLRAREWMKWAVTATALAWVPYMTFFVPQIWGRVSLLEFVVDSANIIAFCLVAAPILWWARTVMLRDARASVES